MRRSMPAKTQQKKANPGNQSGIQKPLQPSQGYCQVTSSGRVMGEPATLESGCRRNFGNLVPRAERGIASRAILVGIEVMTIELEMVVDPTVGGEEALRMSR